MKKYNSPEDLENAFPKFKTDPITHVTTKFSVDPGWQSKNLAVVFIPELKGVPLFNGSPGSGRVYCNKVIHDSLVAAFYDIGKAGLMSHIKKFGGCFAERAKRNSTEISSHAYGISLDFNPDQNGMGIYPSEVPTDYALNAVVNIFKRHGFAWGGDWLIPDCMHFEYILAPTPDPVKKKPEPQHPSTIYVRLDKPKFRSGTLMKDFCVEIKGKHYFVPEGFHTDFLSSPRLLWWLVPPWGPALPAAVVHDYLYSTGEVSRKEADKIFLIIMKELKIPRWKRQVMYLATRSFGWIYYKKKR